MNILAIDTSCDETAVAITSERRVLSNVIYSQILLHKKWGGVVPNLAKRAHEERINMIVEEAIRKFHQTNSESKWDSIDYIAVTYGPGLAVALEVGIKKAKELGEKYGKKVIPINHMEGHIYSCFVQNSQGNPHHEFQFPYLALLVSGGHTELVIFKNHGEYEIIGSTVDDAGGEALDKAAKLLGLGYPGGPVMEELAREAGNIEPYKFPRPMMRSNDFNMSFSGLKTSFYYFIKEMGEQQKNTHIKELASSFQEAVFDTLIRKTEKAMQKTGINSLVLGGGVAANMYLRKKMRTLVQKNEGSVLFPPYKYLTGDNAAMIGVAAYYNAQNGKTVSPSDVPDRVPRLSL